MSEKDSMVWWNPAPDAAPPMNISDSRTFTAGPGRRFYADMEMVYKPEMEKLRKDAERYRWLRTAGAWESEIGMGVLSECPEKFDAAVDAAMAPQELKTGTAASNEVPNESSQRALAKESP